MGWQRLHVCRPQKQDGDHVASHWPFFGDKATINLINQPEGGILTFHGKIFFTMR